MKLLEAIFFGLLVIGSVGCGSSSDSISEITQVSNGLTQLDDDESSSEIGAFSIRGEFGAITLTGKSYEDIEAELEGATLIDIRTAWERDYYGYPQGFENNAAYQDRDYSLVNSEAHYNSKPHNDNFVDEVKELVNNDLNKKIVLICDSSSRSGAHYDGSGEYPTKDSAAKELSDAGFTNVYHVKGGYRGDADGNYANGWEDIFANKIVKK